MDHTSYVPILKGKEGEYEALKELPNSIKARLVPLIEIIPIPWDFENNVPAKSLDDHLSTVNAKLLDSWGKQHSCFLDLCWIPESERMADGTHPVTCVLDGARANGLLVIPVTGLRRDRNYQAGVKRVAGIDNRGVCVRLENEDFKNYDELNDDLTRLLNSLSLNKTSVDLLLDFRQIAANQTASVSLTAQLIISILNEVNEWRSLIFAASGFPINLGDVTPDTIATLPRTEWAVWQTMINGRRRLPRLPTFADYAINHPDPLADIDPRLLRLSAGIRYATKADWLVLKGRLLKKYKYVQFHQLAKKLIARPEYAGRNFSWGDEYITLCAGRTKNPGSLTIWRKVGTNHHLTLVCDQLSNFAWP